MSILLDALRKSEEQRQLGKAPGIHAPADHDPGGDEPGGRPLVPVLLLAVAAILVGTFAWTQFRVPEGLPGPPATAAVTAEPATATRPEPPAAAGSTERPAPSPVASYTAPEEPAAQATADSEQRRLELARKFNQFRAPAEPAVSGGQPSDPGDAAGTTGTDSAQAPPRTEPRRTVARPANQPVSFWELPQNVRDSMPELRITVMVYAEQAADRFLLLNGRRMVEGDSVEGLRLEEIQRHGAVFTFRNYRFLVED